MSDKANADAAGENIEQSTVDELVKCVRNGDKETLLKVLDQKGWNVIHRPVFPFSLYSYDDVGTLLHVACANSQFTIVKLLLEKGVKADINTRSNTRGYLPLHVSAVSGDTKTSELLISSGCSVDALCTVSGSSPLYYASLYGRVEIVTLLLKHNANVNCVDTDQQSPLSVASYWSEDRTAADSIVQLLVKSGADIDHLDKDHDTPLHHAVYWGHTSTVRVLIKFGADVNIKNKRNLTPLCEALAKDKLEAADELVTAQNFRKPSDFLDTVVQHVSFACTTGDRRLFDVVFAKIAEANHELKQEILTYAVARLGRKVEQANSREDIGRMQELDVLRSAAEDDNTTLLRITIACICRESESKEADGELVGKLFEMCFQEPRNPPFDVILVGALRKLNALRKIDVNARDKLLHRAARSGNLAIADMCISSGALQSADQWTKPTPVDIATQRGHSRLAEKLRKALGDQKLLNLGSLPANIVPGTSDPAGPRSAKPGTTESAGLSSATPGTSKSAGPRSATSDVSRSEIPPSADVQTVPLTVVMEIAQHFMAMFDCTRLAVFLEVSHSDGIITLLQSSNPRISAQEAAFEILKRWREEKGTRATGDVLFHVLKDKLEKYKLAEKFKDALFFN